MLKYSKAIVIGMIVAVLGIALELVWGCFSPSGFITSKEHSWLLKARGPIEAPSEVVIVAFNEKMAARLGQKSYLNQWSRKLHAELIHHLVQRGASVIVFDVFFEEARIDEDDALESAIREAECVVLIEEIDLDENGPPGNSGKRYSLHPPQSRLSDAAAGLGPWPIEQEDLVNQFWTFRHVQDEAFKDTGHMVPTLPSVVLQVHAFPVLERFMEILNRIGFPFEDLPRNPADIKSPEALKQLMASLYGVFQETPRLLNRFLSALESLSGEGVPETDLRLIRALADLYGDSSSYFYNFYGPPATIHTIDYDQIIDGYPTNTATDGIDLRGKIIFIGSSDPSTFEKGDYYRTAFGQDDGTDLSGVEVAATAFANLLTGTMIRQNPRTNLLLLLFFGLGVGCLASIVPGIRAIAAVAATGVIYIILAVVLFVKYDFWFSTLVPVMFQLPFALFLGLISQYLWVRKERDRFIPYVPAKVSDLPVSGKVFGTCLLTDIRDSRSISSRLSPAEYQSLLDSYYDSIIPPVVRNGGRVWDFSGDGMMCLFAAKSPELDVRCHACSAAVEIIKEVQQFNQKQSGDKNLRTGIGLHSGWIELGGKTLGDVGNTVASIEGLNKYLGTKILATHVSVEGLTGKLSTATLASTKKGGDAAESLLFRRMGAFDLPGKSGPTDVFEIMGSFNDAHNTDSEREAKIILSELFTDAVMLFEKRRWTESAEILEQILSLYSGDTPSQLLLKNCRSYQDEPPPQDSNVIVRIK